MKKSLIYVILIIAILCNSIMAACNKNIEDTGINNTQECTYISGNNTSKPKKTPSNTEINHSTEIFETYDTATAPHSINETKTNTATPLVTVELPKTTVSKTTPPRTYTPKTTVIKTTAKVENTVKPSSEIYKTITYEGKVYNILMGRNGNPSLVKDKKTLPLQLQPYVYPYDIEGIRADVTKYAKTKGFIHFGDPQNIMNQELKWNCSWYNPVSYSYSGDSYYNSEEDEVDGAIFERKYIFQSKIDSLAKSNETGLAIWFVEYGSNDCLWNGKPIKEYEIYFFYGWDGFDMPIYTV